MDSLPDIGQKISPNGSSLISAAAGPTLCCRRTSQTSDGRYFPLAAVRFPIEKSSSSAQAEPAATPLRPPAGNAGRRPQQPRPSIPASTRQAFDHQIARSSSKSSEPASPAKGNSCPEPRNSSRGCLHYPKHDGAFFRMELSPPSHVQSNIDRDSMIPDTTTKVALNFLSLRRQLGCCVLPHVGHLGGAAAARWHQLVRWPTGVCQRSIRRSAGL
jgi:hypothetical protein